eukprot:gene11739-28821_t
MTDTEDGGSEAGPVHTNDLKIFVGNLKYSATNVQLSEHFGRFGEVVGVKIVLDRTTNKSKGFGFITFGTAAAATAAVAGVNGTSLDGRPLTVRMATARGVGPIGGAPGGGGLSDIDPLMAQLLQTSADQPKIKRENGGGGGGGWSQTKSGGGGGGGRGGGGGGGRNGNSKSGCGGGTEKKKGKPAGWGSWG